MDFMPLFLADNDEELVIFNTILNTKNRYYHYLKKKSGFFHLDELSDNFCFTNFRFYKTDIRRLRLLFQLPEEIILKTGVKVSGEEAICILIRRLAYPNRYSDMMQLFPRGRSALSAIFNAVVRHIIRTKGFVLKNLDQVWLSRQNVRRFCRSIYEKGSPYTRCFGFLDGTVRPICRPTYNQRQFYNGYKKVHAIKFQSLILPNGIIANLFGPVNGRRHDGLLLAKSRLINKLESKFNGVQSPPYLYSDSAYPLKKLLIVPFKPIHNRTERMVNKQMSKLRISVEWGFAKIIALFPFLDFKKNLKVYKQQVGNFYKVATILTNCHTCLYGSQVSDYFECYPPVLEEYLGNQ